MGTTAKYTASRSFWHLLFPFGATEVFHADDGAEIRQTFDDAFCTALIDARKAYVAGATRFGMPPQPIPCSLQHSIASRLAGMSMGQETGIADPRNQDRAGNCFGLAFSRGAKDADGAPVPDGVWGLIEWPMSSIWAIEDGTRMALSPTTWASWAMRDGTMIDGPFLGEIGVVDVPALDTIGTLRERLPHDALQVQTEDVAPLTIVETIVETYDPTALRAARPIPRSYTAAAPIMRHAIARGAHMDTDTTDATMPDTDPETPDTDPGDNDTTDTTTRMDGATEIELTDEFVDRLVARMIERGYTVERAATPGADDTASATGADDGMDVRAVTAAAKSAAAAQIMREAKALRLPASNVQRALDRVLTGKPYGDLLIDPASLATSGATGTPANAPPAHQRSAANVPRVFTSEDAREAVLRSQPKIADDANALARAVDAQRAAWTKAGGQERFA